MLAAQGQTVHVLSQTLSSHVTLGNYFPSLCFSFLICEMGIV